MRRSIADELGGRKEALLASDCLAAVWLKEAARFPAELLPEFELRAELTLLALESIWADADRFTLQLALQPEPGRRWMKLRVEQLEERNLPTVGLVNGTLALVADGPAPVHTESVSSQGNQIVAILDGQAQAFPAGQVQRVVEIGDPNAPNVIQNTTSLPGALVAGSQGDTLFPGTGNDVALGGAGADVIYALVGTHTLFSQGGAADRIFTNPGNLTLAGPEDHVTTFFGPGRTPGAGSVQLQGDTLYITPTNNGSLSDLSDLAGGGFLLFTDLGDGRGVQSFAFGPGAVRQIAFFGGAGNDTFLNGTAITEAAYGAAGNDLLVTGRNDFGLAKGSGGNDTIVAFNNHGDYSGNAGADTILFEGNGAPPRKPNTFRVDALDQLFGNYAGDQFLTP